MRRRQIVGQGNDHDVQHNDVDHCVRRFRRPQRCTVPRFKDHINHDVDVHDEG